MKREYASQILKECYLDAQSMYKIGAITAEQMAEFDESCLVVAEPELQPRVLPARERSSALARA
ncbi:MAG: hypothetical protein LBS97_00475 [Treponema sp.]|jgi:DNA-binding transcriptional regulator YiaG|nr:hypothetical protein [Treponema sp.]